MTTESLTDRFVKFTPAYAILFNFSNQTGQVPRAGLTELGGKFFGTTTQGGSAGHGTVFSISPSGKLTTLYNFQGGSDGDGPVGGLVDVNGIFYGTTDLGGGTGCSSSLGCGTVFSISPSGKETILYRFSGGADAANPTTSLIYYDGAFFGTTRIGGSGVCACGTVYKVTTAGLESVIYNFQGQMDGAYPGSGLTAVNGLLYGTTAGGGNGRAKECSGGPYPGCGTVFSVSMTGMESTIYSFQGKPDGAFPSAGLTNVNGMLFGTTVYGGTASRGTVFGVTTGGAEQVVHDFVSSNDGENPGADLLNFNGTLFGTTPAGGLGCGTIFSVTPTGQERVLHDFTSQRGCAPSEKLAALNRTFYGTTPAGHFGTVFSLKF